VLEDFFFILQIFLFKYGPIFRKHFILLLGVSIAALEEDAPEAPSA